VRVVVATTAADHALGVNRALQLEQLGATVYELGSTLAPEIWPSAIEGIASRFAPVAVLVAGRDPRLDGTVRRLQAAGARIVALPVAEGAADAAAGATLVADASPDAAGAAGGEAGQRVPVPVGWLLPEARAAAPPASRDQTRRELGVPSKGRLVVTAVDLVASGRPEDVVVVAARLRQDSGIDFVLVGDGPLAGSVRDLIGFLGIDTIHLRRPRHSLEELAAAADLVLDPSCEPVVRPLVAAALAAGTPVVTAPGGGAESLLAETGGGIVISSVGVADELAAAVRQLLADGRRPAQERARAVLMRQRSIGSAAIRRALLGGGAATAE
jgi:glycosyltransferase involved in cell wall biosynthesis